MRKYLSALGLLAVMRANFERVTEPGRSCRHTLTDNLMCGLWLCLRLSIRQCCSSMGGGGWTGCLRRRCSGCSVGSSKWLGGTSSLTSFNFRV